MILHNDPLFKIYFGDANDDCVKQDGTPNKSFYHNKLKRLQLDNIFFLKQIHSNQGFCINSPSFLEQKVSLFKKEGDFLITNQRKVGIGVLTADCLPIIFYDPVTRSVAVAHVGWKGAVSDIISNVLKQVIENFRVKIEDLVVYLAPCAKVCCYQVQPDFLKNLENCSFSENVILKRDENLFFNLPEFSKIQLLEHGILRENIKTEYNSCTICDPGFHSHRKSKGSLARQSTIVALS